MYIILVVEAMLVGAVSAVANANSLPTENLEATDMKSGGSIYTTDFKLTFKQGKKLDVIFTSAATDGNGIPLTSSQTP
jgi:hypothetical protein